MRIKERPFLISSYFIFNLAVSGIATHILGYFIEFNKVHGCLGWIWGVVNNNQKKKKKKKSALYTLIKGKIKMLSFRNITISGIDYGLVTWNYLNIFICDYIITF